MWDEIFKDLIHRGLKTPRLFDTDNLSGIVDVITNNFANIPVQTCLVHVQRNIIKQTSQKDRTEIVEDFSDIRNSNSRNQANERIEQFCSKWEYKYTRLIRNIRSNNNILTFLDFPKQIQNAYIQQIQLNQ